MLREERVERRRARGSSSSLPRRAPPAPAAASCDAVAPVEALLVGLGEVQHAERLAEAPRRVRPLRLGVEAPKELVALDAVRVLPEHLRLRADGLVEVLLHVARVELREDLGARPVLGVERLRRLVGVDGHLRLARATSGRAHRAASSVDDELRAVVRLLRAARAARVQERSTPAWSPFWLAQLDRLVERLRERRVELERALVERERLVESRRAGAMRRWPPCACTSRAASGPRRSRRGGGRPRRAAPSPSPPSRAASAS